MTACFIITRQEFINDIYTGGSMDKAKREIVSDALRHKNGKVPHQINYTTVYAAMVAKTRGNHVDMDELFDNCIYLLKYKRNTVIEPGVEVDLFDVKWDKRNDNGGDIGVSFDPPIINTDIKPDGSFFEYIMPQPDLEFALSQAKKLEADNRGFFRMFGITVTLYERVCTLRGTVNTLEDLICEPDFIHHILEQITNHHMKILDTVLDCDFDAVYFGDDWGSQRSLVMGADTWREFIKPYLSKLIKKIKSKGKMIVLHSCGNNIDIIGDWVDIGIDCYETVQPEIYDLKKLKNEFGKDIAFYGGVSNQQFLPYATPAEVKSYCREILEFMAKDGGYILSPSHLITPDISIENAFAIIEAAREFNC